MKIGDKIDNYIVQDKIGQGGMGCVMKVQNELDGKEYALKYCIEADEKSLRRFAREVKVVSETKHPNIIEILDKNLDTTPPYFVMPIARGSIHDVIKNIKGDFDKVLTLFEQLCKGVTALHNSGKFHRDIKPRNALILNDGTVAVTDFGLAKIIDKESSTHTSSNDFLGTIGYHAPEQMEAKNSDARTDVFQLGKSFYEMYTGDYPFLINPKKLPSGLVYIIQKATSPDPNDRYQSVSELIQAIKSFKKSLNPKENPKEALENKLIEIEKLLISGYYREELCVELLDLLGNNSSDTGLFIEFFDKIPNKIIEILSSQLQDRFEPVLDLYTEKLSTYFQDNWLNFSYAETVASKMSAIFRSTSSVKFKGIAIRNTLRAAIWLNRFSAMDSFNHMIQQIKDSDEAGFISQILLEEIELYRDIADQIADNDLHPVIVEVKNEAIGHLKEERERNRKEQEEWVKNLFK